MTMNSYLEEQSKAKLLTKTSAITIGPGNNNYIPEKNNVTHKVLDALEDKEVRIALLDAANGNANGMAVTIFQSESSVPGKSQLYFTT